MKPIYKFFLFLLICFSIVACNKLLDKKPNDNVLVPTAPLELQGMLDNPDVFSYGHNLGLFSSDELYFSPSYYDGSLSEIERNVYTWKSDIFGNEIPYDWEKAYEAINYCNVVLEGIKPLLSGATDDRDLNAIQGDALFKRASIHFQLAQLFAPAYNEYSAGTDWGIPLKLTSNPNESIYRPTLRACLKKILADLDLAKTLLPEKPDPAHRNRASQAAVLALTARVRLYMGDWQQTAIAARDAINSYDSLMNYIKVDATAKIPIGADNKEIIFNLKAPDVSGQSALFIGLSGSSDGGNVDTNLIHSFDSTDLRLPIFYRHRTDKTWALRFSIAGIRTPFEGISVSELYLTLAEAYARSGYADVALAKLNQLLVYRYKDGVVPPLPSATDTQAVINRILEERKKELAFHGLRWMDIKRLNKLNMKITQSRKINGTVYSIAPNDLRYALPLPKPTVEKYKLPENAR